MSGFNSLYTGITGLNAYQSWIDLISNNIANVDTTGFKGQSMTFADLFYQNESSASAPTDSNGGINGQQLGYGVQIGSVDTDWQTGGVDTTGVQTNMMINGDGFFMLNGVNGGSPTYTRDGDFSLNQNGLLYDPSNGLAVQGWMANSGGDITTGTPGNLTIPIGLVDQATATGAGTKVGPNASDNIFDVALGGNLDQTQWQDQFADTVNANGQNATAFTVSTTIYDSLGNAHQAEITYVPDTVGATAATFATVGAANATSISVPATVSQNDTITITPNAAGTQYTVKDSQGTTQTVQAGSTTTIGGATITLASPPPGAGSETINVTAATNGLPSDVENSAGQSVAPATRWKVEVSFTDGTTFSTISTPGSIAANGTVTQATYGNGSSGTVGYVYFDKNGQFINSSSVESALDTAGITGTAVDGDIHATGSQAGIAQGNQLNITQWGQSAGNNASAPTAGPAPALGPIALGYWQMSSLAGNENSGTGSGTSGPTVISQNGFAAGTLDNITISQNGIITGAFTNGQNRTLGQVALATFQNENGLTRIGDNEFEPSADSGLAQIGIAGTGRYGAIQAGALEQSNVSLSTEFTNLIVAQRAFEANTRGITTADQNLQTIINLRASEN